MLDVNYTYKDQMTSLHSSTAGQLLPQEAGQGTNVTFTRWRACRLCANSREGSTCGAYTKVSDCRRQTWAGRHESSLLVDPRSQPPVEGHQYFGCLAKLRTSITPIIPSDWAYSGNRKVRQSHYSCRVEKTQIKQQREDRFLAPFVGF